MKKRAPPGTVRMGDKRTRGLRKPTGITTTWPELFAYRGPAIVLLSTLSVGAALLP
jgi:hypothetical protein